MLPLKSAFPTRVGDPRNLYLTSYLADQHAPRAPADTPSFLRARRRRSDLVVLMLRDELQQGKGHMLRPYWHRTSEARWCSAVPPNPACSCWADLREVRTHL